MTDFKKGINLYLKDLPDLNKISENKDNPGGEATNKEYRFFLGFIDHVPEKDKVYLRIPEMTHRDAEGRPLFPEQEQWIRTVLKLKKIKAKDEWFSHWQFDSLEQAENFVQLLLDNHAFEK